ncbi:MAG: hypothetical protein KBS59_06415 [Clostridiales bacterium]|nr:hypothetical protein [Clostridiales bacterium]
MSWKNIKILALAILIVANTVLAVAVRSEYVKTHYYDSRSISELIGLLSQSGISADASVMPKKRAEMNVFSADYDENEFLSFAKIISGAENSDDGYTFVSERGTFTFKPDFSFTYVFESYESTDDSGALVLDARKQKEALNIANGFLRVKELSKAKQSKIANAVPEYKVDKLFFCGGDTYKVYLDEYVSGYRTSDKIMLVISANNVVFAEGKIMMAYPEAEYRSDLEDMLGILTKEKRVFDAQAHEDTVLKNIRFEYDVCFDVFKNLYLIPVCVIEYEDGTEHIYDLVSGKLI